MDIIYKWFTGVDVEKLSNHILDYIKQKMLDTKELQNFPLIDEEDNIKRIIEEHIGRLLSDIQQCMNIEKVIPCTEKEKQEILSMSKQKVKDTFIQGERTGQLIPKVNLYYNSWLNISRLTYEKFYFPYMVKYYDMIYPAGGINAFCLSPVASAQIITGNQEEDIIRQDEALNKEVQLRLIEVVRKHHKYDIYYSLMYEQGENIHRNENEMLKNYLDDLFCKKPIIDKNSLKGNWGTLIYEIVINKFYIAAIDKKRRKVTKIKQYSYNALKEICRNYRSDDKISIEYYSKGLTVEKFINVFKIYQQIDSRLEITYNDDKDNIEDINVSFPENMRNMLFELAFNRVEILNKQARKKIYSYETIEAVIKQIEKNSNKETPSIRQILYDYKVSYIYSYQVFYDIAQRLICEDKKTTGDKFPFDVIEEWNKYTGQLITNSIWSALTENKENDFFILSYNSKAPKEDKEKIDKVLYSCIEEVVNLTNYFSYLETSVLAYKLFSCVGLMVAKTKQDLSSAISIFETMSYVLKNIHSDITYDFWKKQVEIIDEIKELKNQTEENMIRREIYNEYFVRKYTKVKPKQGDAECSKEHILYKKIEKAVLYNLHK